MSLQIGVLSVQGDVAENMIMMQGALEAAGRPGGVAAVRTPSEIDGIDGLIIPGGESTMIGQMSLVNGALKKIREKAQAGMPVLGICAGLVLLSKRTRDKTVGQTDQPLLDLLDVQVERNSFGRQIESFEAGLSLEPLGIPHFEGVFIRAPSISDIGPGVQTVSEFDGKIVAVRQAGIVGVAFHPELTGDHSIHGHFLGMIK